MPPPFQKKGAAGQSVKDLFEKMQVQDAYKIQLQRVHRSPALKKPYPIIARFVWHGDREKVWAARSKQEIKNIPA